MPYAGDQPPEDRPVEMRVTFASLPQPAARMLMSPGSDPLGLQALLQERLDAVFDGLPLEWSLGEPSITVEGVPQQTAEEKLDAMRSLADALIEKHREPEHEEKEGYWMVSGIRHGCLVWAASNTQALQKARDVVQDWEMPEAEFIGVKPEIIPL